MDSEGDQFVQQHMEAFNEQLAAMAYHHNRALALISAARLRDDLHQPKPTQWRQHLRGASQWLKQRLVSPDLQGVKRAEMPKEDEVILIDTTYTVLPPDTKAVNATEEKEE